jgi:hypothetical protein
MDAIFCDGVGVVLAVIVVADREFGLAVAEEALGACGGGGMVVLRFLWVFGQRITRVSSLL